MSTLMAEMVQKAETRLRDDEYVKQVSKVVKDDPEAMAAAEIVLLELALADLDINREAIKRDYQKYRKQHVTKYYRALAKSALPEYIVKHEGGEDGDEPHASGSPQSVHAGRRKDRNWKGERKKKDIKREQKLVSEANRRIAGEEEAERREKQRRGATIGIAALSAEDLAESITNTMERATEPAVAFLSESKLTQSAMAVVNYFANKASTFTYFAKAVKEYGPFVGMRMLNAYFRYGGYDVPLTESASGRRRTEFGDKVEDGESASKTRAWAIETLRKRLPGQNVRESGAEPPSEGFIIDKDGNVLAHGVGRGNDHWLPFSSRHLRKLRRQDGAEYVRRRMTGGITVEDIHAAMMMGVRKVTVVSNSGTYSIDLKGRSHGIRLEHMQVVSRYQELLDKKGKRFETYKDAMETLQAEFPLHFGVSAKEGDSGWLNVKDTIGPKKKFRDELKELFGIGDKKADDDLSSESLSESARSTQSSKTNVRVSDLGLSGWQPGDSIDDWYKRARKSNEPVKIYEHMASKYRAKTGSVPDWVDARLQQAKNAQKGGSTTTTTINAKPTATQQRTQAAAASPPGKETPAEWKNDFQRGYSRMKNRGLDVDNMGDNPHVKRVLKTTSELNAKQWKYVQQNADDFHLGTDDWEAIAADLELLKQTFPGV